MIVLTALARLGAWTLGLLAAVGRFAAFTAHALSHAARPPFHGREIALSLLQIG